MRTVQDAVWPQGYRINPRASGPSLQLVEAFRDVPVAVAGDCLGRCVGTVGIRAYHSNIPKAMCGPAFTVRVRPGDNLMIHKAMTLAQAGDVIVVDGAGDVTQALVGGLMRTSAIAKGFAGFVLDGAVRDTAEWAEGGMPIFARGHTHRGPTKDGPGEINIPIACAGLVVNPGDLILGDSDGVIALPVAILGDLHQRVRAHLAKEAMMRDAFSRNAFDPETFDSILRAKGVPI